MNIRPLHDRILVKRLLEEEEERRGGIIIPDTAKEKPQRGKVIAVGSGRILDSGQRVPLDIKVGDQVLFAKWGGNDIKLGEEEYLILEEKDVLGVIE
jgi:chaperonin GroES